MPRLSDFSIDINGNLFLLGVISCIVILWAFFIYAHTNPVVSNALRRFLLMLRLMVLLLVILFIFEPVIGITFAWKRKPSLGVLIDASASMSLSDSEGSRPDQVGAFLNDEYLHSLAGKAKVSYYTFALGLKPDFQPLKDSLSFDGQGTNIAEALSSAIESIGQEKCAGLIVVTDGAANEGEKLSRFSEKVPVPVFPVVIGSTEENRDLILQSVSTNDIAYVNSEVPVEVRLVNRGFEMRDIMVRLEKEGAVADEELVRFVENQPETRVTLHVIPEMEGFHKYDATIPLFEGEVTHENNHIPFYMRVLKNKLNVLLLAGGPSIDYRFLAQVLQDDENVELIPFVQKRGGEFYENARKDVEGILENADCIILLDFPRADTDNGFLSTVVRYIGERSIPLWLVWGPDIDANRIGALYEFLPLRSAPQQDNTRLVYSFLSKRYSDHPICAGIESDRRIAWYDLPPIYSEVSSANLWANSQVIFRASESPTIRDEDDVESMPLIIARELPQHRSVLQCARGLWRWSLMMSGVGEDDRVYRQFVSNIVRWLAIREERKQFRMACDKEFYHSGETVHFEAQLYSHDYRTVDGAVVSVRIHGPSGVQEKNLNGMGNGKYEADLLVVAQGDYSFEGSAKAGERTFTDRGIFNVDRWNLEFLNTVADAEELRALARGTGGLLLTRDSLRVLEERLDLSPWTWQEYREWQIWNRPLLLIFIVTALTLEWLLRKRRGML